MTYTPTVEDQVRHLEEQLRGLQAALAYEAAVVEAQTMDLKSLAKGRREILARSVARMRRTAAGEYAYYGVSYLSLTQAMADAERFAATSDPRPSTT